MSNAILKKMEFGVIHPMIEKYRLIKCAKLDQMQRNESGSGFRCYYG